MKEYKCIKGDAINFTEGHVYQLRDDGNMKGDDDYTFEPVGCSTAVEWLEKHGFKFEPVSKFKNAEIMKQVVDLLNSGCTGIGCGGECAFNATGICGMAFLRDVMSRLDGATEITVGNAIYSRQDYMTFASLNKPHN